MARQQPDSGAANEQEARLAHALGRWWLEERPAWTESTWWETEIREDVRRLLWLPAGPQLASALAELETAGTCPLPHGGLRMFPDLPTPGHAPGWPCPCKIVTAAAWEACTAWACAGAAVALVDAAGHDVVVLDVRQAARQINDPAREELAPALRSTTGAMGNRIGAARGLVAHPALVELVASAAVSAWAARQVVMEVEDLEPEDASRVVRRVCELVQMRLFSGRRAYNSAEVNRLTRSTRLRLVGAQARQEQVRAFGRRRVLVLPEKNGMATLIAELAEADAHRIHRRLTAIAAGLERDHADDGDVRTRDQVRADTLVDLLLGGPHLDQADSRCDHTGAGEPDDPPPADVTGPGAGRPEIQVIVSLSTLMGVDDEPGQIPGLGPVSAEVARELAAEGSWTAWITDASGAVTATGSRTYVPSAGLARLIRAREPHCRFPGCRQPATRCDLDHAFPWPVGSTNAANLGPLCRRHHVMKTHGGWQLDVGRSQSDEGAVTDAATPPIAEWRWRTPAGFTIPDRAGSSLE